MTIPEFLVELAADIVATGVTPRLTAYMSLPAVIDFGTKDSNPICALQFFTERRATNHREGLANRMQQLGMSHDDAWKIMCCNDGYDYRHMAGDCSEGSGDYDPAVRAGLLKACGLA